MKRIACVLAVAFAASCGRSEQQPPAAAAQNRPGPTSSAATSSPPPSSLPAVISDAALQAAQLTADERRIVDEFTRGLPAGAFRVSGAGETVSAIAAQMFAAQDRVRLTLPDGSTVVFQRTAAAPRETSVTWVGRNVEGLGDGIFVLSQRGITGTVRLPRGVFSLIPLQGGRQLILRADQRPAPPDHPPDYPTGARGRRIAALADEPPLPTCSSTQTTVDVLAVYTARSRAELPSIADSIQLAFDEMIVSFGESQVRTRSRLVGVEEIKLAEVQGDFAATLSALASSPEVRDLRNRKLADLVVMVVADTTSAGLADEILATPETAFSVVALSWMNAPHYSFGHEIGHLFGARHDPGTDPDPNPFPHGHGFIDPQSGWRTIMAYDKCACPRVGRWANPSVAYDDGTGARQTGTPSESDDAKVLTTTTRRLSQFRCSST